HLETIVQHRGDHGRATRRLEEYAAARLKGRETLREKQDALKRLQDSQTVTANLYAKEETQLRAAEEQLKDSTARITTLKGYEEQERRLEQVRADLARLPGAPAAVVRQHRDQYDTLNALNQAVPVLGRFRTLRDDLAQALEAERAAEAA